jgi:hypothetical protein
MTTDTITARHLASRLAGKRSVNLAGAIYGTIVATAIVAGLGERASVSAPRALWIVLASGLFFWAAHVYAAVLAQRIQEHRGTTRKDVAREMVRDLPLFYSSFPVAVPLVLGCFGVLGAHTALGVATAVGVVSLVGWGVRLAYREGLGLGGIVAAASLNAAVGMFIVGLKVAVR